MARDAAGLVVLAVLHTAAAAAGQQPPCPEPAEGEAVAALVGVVRDQGTELRVPLATRVLPLEPLRVTVTGRDPYLVEVGFYDRMERLEEGYFALGEEIRPYRLLSTLFQFKRELLIRFPPSLLLVDGRPARWLGYRRLDEIPLRRIRGLEAMRCGSMPARYLRYLEGPLDCNVVFIWLR